MSVKATTWVWEESEAPGNARLVLLAIADAADAGGDNAWPSQATIARMCRLSVRTVRRLVADLVALGELEVVEHGGCSYREDRRPHLYRLPKMPGGTGGHPDRPHGRTGGQPDTNGRTRRTPRADTVVPITPSLDPPSKNPSGGSASPEQPGPQAQEDDPMPAIAESQGSLFDAMPLKTNPATEPREPGAHTVVAAFVDSYRQHHSGGDPVKRDIGRVARDAKAILTAGRATVEELVLAAKLTGSGPYSNIGVSLNINRDNGKRPGTRSKGIAPPTPHDDPVWSEMVARQAEERTARGEDPALAEWLAGASEQDAQAARAGDAA